MKENVIFTGLLMLPSLTILAQTSSLNKIADAYSAAFNEI
jgi:hypothetical protein